MAEIETDQIRLTEVGVTNRRNKRDPQQEKRRYHDGFIDEQFIDHRKPKVPYKAIALAIFLFTLGTVLIVVGALLLAGYFDVKYSDRTWPVLTLGLITFIPGFYHVRIAYYAYQGYRGYSYSDIPDFDD